MSTVSSTTAPSSTTPTMSASSPAAARRVGGSSPTSGGSGAKGHAPGSAFLARLSTPGTLAKIGLLGGAGVWLFWSWVYAQSQWSMSSGDWSHAFMVPAICAYLLWQHRAALDGLKASVFWPGVIPIAMGIWSYVFFIVGFPNHLGQGMSMTLTVFGAALLLLGPRYMTYLFFPIAYLMFAVTVPEKIMNHVTWPLQNIAAKGGWLSLNMIGIKTDIAGNQLTVFNPTTLKSEDLNVAEACSGMRMLIAFLALGAAVALVSTKMWWKRVVLLGLAAPLAVLLNVVRIMVLGIMSLYNPNFSTGVAHTFIGTMLLIPGFIIYMLILVALNKAVPEVSKTSGGPGSAAPPKPAKAAGAGA